MSQKLEGKVEYQITKVNNFTDEIDIVYKGYDEDKAKSQLDTLNRELPEEHRDIISYHIGILEN